MMGSQDKISFFFIIGRARSGTTLLRTMLDAHPNVTIPLESPLIMHLSDRYSKITRWNENLLLSFYKDVLEVKDFSKWHINEVELKNKILSQSDDITFQELINLIYLESKSFFPKSEILLIGDKNPVYSISINSVFRLYPNAKYIHLQRDYRAHILSMLNAGLYATDIVALAFRWKYSAQKISKLKIKYTDQFYSIKYEDLVHNPELYMKEICSFLNIPYDPDMINYHTRMKELYKEVKDKIEDHHKRVFQPIDVSRIDSWKNDLSESQIRTADYVVGNWAENEGYKRWHLDYKFEDVLKIQPALLYQRIFYVYRYFYTKVPGVIRNLIGR